MKLNKQTLLLIGIVLIGLAAYSLIPNFEREEFNPDVIEEISSGNITTTTIEQKNSNKTEEEVPNITEEELFEESVYDTLLINNQTDRINDIFTTYLVIGSDERTSSSSASRGFTAGSRADVIILVLLDKESYPTLISIPRDLLIKDPCSQKIQRINSSYVNNDCGTAAENLSAALLNITGLKVSHFAKFSFEGFEKIIDSFGGIEICVDETQREGYSFEIQKGCNNLSGDIALNWVVSRNTEVLDGEKIMDEDGNDISSWKPMKGVSDLTRIKKQQQVIVSLMSNLNKFDSLNQFLKFVNALEDTFTIDKNISLVQATELVWSFRNFDFENIKKLTVPTYNYTTEAKAQVLILDMNFYDFLVSNNLVKWKIIEKIKLNNINKSAE